MTRRTILAIALLVTLAVAAWVLIFAAPRWYTPREAAPAATAPAAEGTAAERKINATLYYISEDGLSLIGVPREVPFGEPVVEQARRIIEIQLGDAPAPLASAVPAGTTLRALFVSEQGDAFIDLSGDVSAKHTGGSLDELFTVYALVNALTINLPAITRVQILIDGHEVDTLAGHVDLRHPLQKSLKWIRSPEDAGTGQ
jgi:hypothetical protein